MRTSLSLMFCPAGTINTASTRLRCLVLARELQRIGCRVHVGFDASVVPDVLYVQKVSSPEIIAHAAKVRAAGGQVVFDIDDWGDALPWITLQPHLLSGLLQHCNAVSVDTAVRAEVFGKDPAFVGLPIWTVPDPMDYFDARQNLAVPQGENTLLNGCWFGNGPNLPPAIAYVQSAAATGRLGAFNIITNEKFVPQLQQAFPALSVEAWALETFPAKLRAADFTLLIHDSNLEGVQKSNNKMLAALGQGVVPLVSNTPAYAELAQQIGLPELVLEGPADMARVLAPGMLQKLREGIASADCQAALEHYKPAFVARQFLDLVTLTGWQPERPKDPVRINLGCGDMPLPGYVNVDVAAERRGRQPDVLCDIRDLSVFPNEYADEVMAIHVIEHFYRWEVVDLLKEWVRVLKPGGQLVLECPNLISACEALLKNPYVASQPGVDGNRSMWCFYGDPSWKDPLMCHRWLYTPQSLAQVMQEAGLRQLSQQPALFKAREPRDMRIVGVKPAAAKDAP